MTKVVFMGTPEFSVSVLNMLVEEKYEVVAVVTQPDRAVGRKRVMTPPPVKVAAENHDLTVLQPEKLRDSEELQQLIDLQPDILVTAAYGQILPNALLEAPKLGSVNVHASLLPKYRGGAPIHQAIMDGETETGITIMYMAEKLDAGDIISQRSIPIKPTDTTGTMFEKLSVLGADLLKETLPELIEGTASRTPQNEELVSFARNISREQERIDWSNEAKAIFDQVRGLNPWPGAFTTWTDQPFKIWSCNWSETSKNEAPGTIVEITQSKLGVQATNQTIVYLEEVQPSGKKRMFITDFLRGVGQNVQLGDRFE